MEGEASGHTKKMKKKKTWWNEPSVLEEIISEAKYTNAIHKIM